MGTEKSQLGEAEFRALWPIHGSMRRWNETLSRGLSPSSPSLGPFDVYGHAENELCGAACMMHVRSGLTERDKDRSQTTSKHHTRFYPLN
jgi:hypothetical protein